MRRRVVIGVLALGAATGGFGRAARAQPNPDFWVSNRSDRQINQIHVSPTDQDSWGRDWLGEHVLPPGHRFAIRPPRDGRCLYDIRVVYADGTTEERRRQNVCAVNEIAFQGAAATPTSPRGTANPDFRLVNRSGRTIMQVFVSSANDQSWGVDRLGQDVLPNGRAIAIRLPRESGCVYDIRVVYDNDTAAEKRRVNTCAISEVVFP